MQNEQLKQAVESENDIKNMIVEYVGEKLPEFVLAIAEENWVRGYQQGLSDVEDGQKLVENEKQKTCKLCEK